MPAYRAWQPDACCRGLLDLCTKLCLHKHPEAQNYHYHVLLSEDCNSMQTHELSANTLYSYVNV